eukprot:3084298-Pyramimonas_sp.AAC.1
MKEVPAVSELDTSARPTVEAPCQLSPTPVQTIPPGRVSHGAHLMSAVMPPTLDAGAPDCQGAVLIACLAS